MLGFLRSDRFFYFGFVLCVLFLFYPGLLFSQVPAFRDGFLFYYPQAQWQDYWLQRGDYFPSWNSLSGFGYSVPGQVSSALYYPLRILWLLDLFTVEQRYAAFLAVHVLIAALGIHLASRSLALTTAACRFTAVSYALSCPVIFNHSNLIFLCSASYVGFAVAAVIRMSSKNTWDWSSLLLFSFATAMMLLGGDPHTAANAFILTAMAFMAALLTRHWPLVAESDSEGLVRPLKLARLRFGWLTACFLLVGVATAVQWFPAARWASLSDRAPPQLVDQLMQSIDSHKGAGDGALEIGEEHPYTPESKAHRKIQLERAARTHRIYDFSLSPWHLATVAWPTIGGHYSPQNGRLFSLLPSEGRMWVPSIYCGFLTTLVLLSSIARWHWVTRLMLLFAGVSLVASFGNYSPTWVCSELLELFGHEAAASRMPSDSVGSLYWVFVQLVPGYESFRYPAKWTVWFAAFFVLAAGCELEHHRFRNRTLLHWLLPLMACLPLALLLTIWWLPDAWLLAAGDRWLGPPTKPALSSALIIGGTAPFIALAVGMKLGTSFTQFASWLALAEMTIVCCSWVHFIEPPTEPNIAPSTEASFLWANYSKADILGDTSLSTAAAEPANAQTIANYESQWQLGRLSNRFHIRNLGASHSVQAIAVSRLKQRLRELDNLHTDAPQLDAILSDLGVTHRLVRGAGTGERDASLRWQQVPSPRPLCEFIAPSFPPNQATVQYDWVASDTLEITVDVPSKAKLLVRQIDDGGWRVGDSLKNSAIDSSHCELLPYISAGEIPWISLEFAPGRTVVQLHRRWLY